MLPTLVILLAATAVAVPLTRHAGFGSVLGYLLAGIAIGPAGLGLVTNVDAIASVASLGVVMLLFLIGLELRPQRLWVMRRAVFGLGTAQVLLSGAALAGLAHLAGVAWPGAVVLGSGLAMSSTAIVLPLLAERELLPTRAGRDGFAVLLFQDLAFIPLVALVPLLATNHVPDHVPWQDVVRAAAAVAVILVGGRFLLTPMFRAIGGARTPELFTAVALLIVAGSAWLATLGGLSPSLGAFLAGSLLSDSEYRHELEADIAPFEGLLLGFFFISVGMSATWRWQRRGRPCWRSGRSGCWPRRPRSRWCWRVWRGTTGPTRCVSPSRCRRGASSVSCCSRRRWARARWGPGQRRWQPCWSRSRCWRRRSCSRRPSAG
jgi:monovalent cation:proton antiporter-2 (CPA2) family protein